jgi:hypothetical protein
MTFDIPRESVFQPMKFATKHLPLPQLYSTPKTAWAFLTQIEKRGHMYNTLRVAAVAVAMIAAVSVRIVGQSGVTPLEGVWAVEEITFAKPVEAPPNKPVGLVLFSGRHYSMMFLTNSGRKNFGEGGPDKATADQLHAVWDPLTANAGTFTVTGNTVRTTPSVAKMPDVMAAGAFTERTFSVKGDTLLLTSTRSNTGAAANPQTIRLRRMR